MSSGAGPPHDTPVVAAPVGLVSFLFTDVVGGTGLWEEQPERMAALSTHYDTLVAAAIAPHGGYLFQTAGAARSVAFADAAPAVAATLALARALQAGGADPAWRTSAGHCIIKIVNARPRAAAWKASPCFVAGASATAASARCTSSAGQP